LSGDALVCDLLNHTQSLTYQKLPLCPLTVATLMLWFHALAFSYYIGKEKSTSPMLHLPHYAKILNLLHLTIQSTIEPQS